MDGDTPDWIEFYNSGTSAVNLNGYGLSDKKDDPFQWIFPDFSVNPGEYLLVFASGKDRRESPYHWNTIISSGDDWKYWIPTSEPLTNWRFASFNDSNWLTGKSGFGFGDNDDATTIPRSNSIFIRKKFTISDLTKIRQLMFHMDYDDGFVAYLNGVEIARANMLNRGDFPRFDVFANALHEALIYQKLPPEAFSVSNPASILKNGENILAIQVHNSDLTSSDLSAIPFLSIATSEIEPNARTVEILSLPESELHTNFKISADGESLYLTSAASELADSAHIGIIPMNASYGRTIKNPAIWAIFSEPTPEKENLGPEYNGEKPGLPVFSSPAGIYRTAFKILLNAPVKGDSVYYTVDGSVPTRSSKIAKGEIPINRTRVLRARILKSGMLPGDILTNSYIIYNNNKKLPVVSVSMDSLDLWDYNTGIYVNGPNWEVADPHGGTWPEPHGANYWMDWEKACHFEMLETIGNKVIDVDAGTKISGAWSRANPQKSMTFHCRKSYGPSFMKYKIFDQRPFDEFKTILLRNSGNDWNNTMFRDGLMSDLTIGLNVDQMAFRPSIFFLNGNYWGILNIREKVDEDFIASNNPGVKASDVIMLENNGDVRIGNADDWLKMCNFMDQNSMTVQANYDQVAAQIDISSFTDYFTSQIFFRNHDWPGNNIRYWKTTDPASKWRWILYDTDFGMGIWYSSPADNTLALATDPNGPGWPNPPWSTLMLRKLLENTGFRNQFVNRFADLMNSRYLPDQIYRAIDEKANLISEEIGKHMDRWGGSQPEWLNNVEYMKSFASSRSANVFSNIQQKFNFQVPQMISVMTDSLAGSVQLNSLLLTTFPWQGTYFPNVPIKLTAIPKAGFRFQRWEGVTANSNQETISVSPKAQMQLKAVFESDGSHFEDIVINEISFNNAAVPDPGDWIEIYNKGKYEIDISGWKFTDSDPAHQFVFAANTRIKAGEYLVVTNDLIKMNAVFGSVKNLIGTFGFGLGNLTDAVRLYSQFGQLIDEVSYSNVVPWPTFDLTRLWSLELSNPGRNNNLATSWEFSVGNGTPGLHNASYIPDAVDELTSAQIVPELEQNYPNPFIDGTSIKFKLDKPGKYQVTVLDINGRIIRSLNDNDPYSILHTLYWDGKDDSGKPVPSGVYFYRLECSIFSKMNRMVKM